MIGLAATGAIQEAVTADMMRGTSTGATDTDEDHHQGSGQTRTGTEVVQENAVQRDQRNLAREIEIAADRREIETAANIGMVIELRIEIQEIGFEAGAGIKIDAGPDEVRSIVDFPQWVKKAC